MKLDDLVSQALEHIEELFPWDLEELLQQNPDTLLLDVREPEEFKAMHIRNSINVPRGILESACEYDYEDTVPELVEARNKDIVVICRSGKRSVLAADTMRLLGYSRARSLKTGLRGWSDYELELVNNDGRVIHEDEADDYFTPRLRPEQLSKNQGAAC